MKFYHFILVFIFFALQFNSDVGAVNGTMEQIQGQNVLHVWGSHFEMGYANGYLNGSGIMEMVEDYMIGYFFDPVIYNLVRPVFNASVAIQPVLEEEFQGMMQGIKDSGADIYIESLKRNVDILDLRIMNAGPEANVFCSSLSGWGEATYDDPLLRGELVIARDMDWTADPYGILYKNALITTYSPEDPDEQKWVSIGYSGIIGCLSGFNESGIGVFLNMGNQMFDSFLDGSRTARDGKVYLELLTLRMGIENDDYDKDGHATIKDIYQAVLDYKMAGSYDIHVVSPYAGSILPVPAAVIEAHYSAGVVPRFASFDKQLTEFLLEVTNHHRKLFPPEYCWRYLHIRERLSEDFKLTCREAWDIEADVASGTMQTILYRPAKLDCFVSFAESGKQAPFVKPVHYSWNDLFN